jgi:predicted nucleic acid-binding protein
MPRKPKAIVLDAWAIMAYLEDEPAGKLVADWIADAHENGIAVMLTVVNAGEIWYTLAREVSEAEANNSIAELRELGIEMVDVDWKLTHAAAQLKARHRMSYADCYAAALAKEEKAELVTGDGEFKQVEGDVKIRWL